MIFMSWNVKGLSDLARKYLVHDEIIVCMHQLGALDFLCLQEIKVSSFRLQSAYTTIWPKSHFFITNHCDNKCGGVLFVAKK